MPGKGKLFVVSAPSGAGKTTLIRHVLSQFPDLSYSVSSTTRSPRENEVEGIDYHFLSIEQFEEKIEQGEWLEWARVHDNYYGTSKQIITSSLEKGCSILLDIDVQGAGQVMASELEPVTVFIEPPSMEILAARLKGRGTDSDDVIKKRLENAVKEMKEKDRYNYCLVNDVLETAINELIDIFKKEMT